MEGKKEIAIESVPQSFVRGGRMEISRNAS